jgi:iron complex outermembrane receptor protein
MKVIFRLLVPIAALVLPSVVIAQQDASDEVIEEVITVGSRNAAKPRTASDSPVPIDVLDAENFNAMGSTADLTDNMKALVPSYTASPATGDGSAFVRPTSLRGTAPDQMLVLVNGKRRHRSSLVHFFAPAAGNGAHGPDIGMIPSIGLKRVEVLRDGASSQYGSDAIAGVIDNDALSRGLQRPDAQALADQGIPVGLDAPFGDTPLVQSWGRPETEGVRFYLNSGFDISDQSQLYARFSLADTDGRYRFFYRQPDHSSLTQHRLDGYTGLPGGYTPFLDGAQDDASIVLGIDGEFDSGMSYDFSFNYGKNELDYFLNNTVNGDLPLDGVCPACEISQRGFDVGGYAQEETNINADFGVPVSDNVFLAFGLEIREEVFTAYAGEATSFEGGGSSGFRGVEPSNAGEFSRDNTAFYADIEHDITDRFLLQYAARYENFSDFGSTLNGKLAARFRISDGFALRGAVSTGFHAPTPGQTNISNIITTFDSGVQVEEGLVPSTSDAAKEAGGTALVEENAVNISAGFTADFGDNWTLTADVYQIEVSDRIYRTGSIDLPPLPGSPPGAPGRAISFFTNALDVEHQGMDIVLDGRFDIGSTSGLDLTFVYSYNTIEVTDQKAVNGVIPVSDAKVEDIENNYPESRAVLTGNFLIGESFNVLARANYYGDHYDENGRIGPGPGNSAKVGSIVYLDLEAGWNLNDNWRLVVGAMNITDEYIDEIGPPNANALSSGLQYTRRSVANYEGGSYYLRANFNW